MRTVLIINHRISNCGVYQFGKRVYEAAVPSKDVRYIYAELDKAETYLNVVLEYNPDVILYNWHRGTMPWLSETLVKHFPRIKHYFIYHEEFTHPSYDKYLFFGDYDFSGGRKFGDKKALIPRPLLNYTGTYVENKRLTIGSFGFGFKNKGYVSLAKLVNDTFSEAVINFHMPFSHFGDPLRTTTMEVASACRNVVTNPGITLNISHEFLDNSGVLKFLAGNDINAFMYDENGEGISSVIDYALSVRRPIAISSSRMFRHIASDEIILGRNSLEGILKAGTKPLEPLYKKWSVENFRQELDKEFV